MTASRLSIVVIGRNEGARLERCLDSICASSAAVVYVDSGSSDGSPQAALARGASLVTLDPSASFTAALARNAGFTRARVVNPAADFVQFVDGDCELSAGWLDAAQRHLDGNPAAVAVCGRRRERAPGRSLYNLICDLEWDTPIGVAKSFGGDAMVRVGALAAVGGYRPDLIAGEEPELCVRLRARGGQIHRIAHEMTLHDANILQFGQWWRRAVRAGHAFAEGAALHGAAPERHWVREARSTWLWTSGVLGATLVAAALLGPTGLLLLLIYPLQVLRMAAKDNTGAPRRLLRAGLTVLGKFAELQGQLRYARTRRRGGASTLIEYK